MSCRRMGKTGAKDLGNPVNQGISRFNAITAVKGRKVNQVDKYRHPLPPDTAGFLLLQQLLRLPVKSMGSQKAGIAVLLQGALAHITLHQAHHPQGPPLPVHRRTENTFNPDEMARPGFAGTFVEIVISPSFTALIQTGQGMGIFVCHEVPEKSLRKFHELLL